VVNMCDYSKVSDGFPISHQFLNLGGLFEYWHFLVLFGWFLAELWVLVKCMICLLFTLLLDRAALTSNSVVPISGLYVDPYSAVLCYPRISQNVLEDRIRELKNLGVAAVEFAGKANAFNVPVLGKGYVGVVVIAHADDQRFALKIRRIDASREGLQHEAQMLEKANSVNVGPRFVRVSQNFLLMEFIDGDLLPCWLEKMEKRQVLQKVLRETIAQCAKLDSISLDHGELSKAPKHVIIDRLRNPCIVDFETASVRRKPANVNAICQYFFLSRGTVARLISENLGPRNLDNIVDTLRVYKHSGTQKGLEQVLEACLY